MINIPLHSESVEYGGWTVNITVEADRSLRLIIGHCDGFFPEVMECEYHELFRVEDRVCLQFLELCKHRWHTNVYNDDYEVCDLCGAERRSKDE